MSLRQMIVTHSSVLPIRTHEDIMRVRHAARENIEELAKLPESKQAPAPQGWGLFPLS